MRNYTLFTAVGSPASNKIRAYFRWRNVPYRERSATADVLRTFIRPRLKTVDVPVITTPSGDMLRDTRCIIDAVEAREPGDRLLPPHAHQRFACRLIEAFGDEWMGPAMVSERWFDCPETMAMEVGLSVYPDTDRDTASRQARLLSELLKGKLAARGFTHANRAATQRLLGDITDTLEQHFTYHNFLFGDRPSPADFSLFGALALDTEALFRAPDGARDRPALRRWLSAINAPWSLAVGEFRRAYEFPPTLTALLRQISARFIPEAVATCEAVADWAETHPGRPVLPYVVDRAWSDSSAPDTAKPLRTETQWLLQRMLEPMRGEVAPAEQRGFEAVLQAMECDFLQAYTPGRTLERHHNQFRASIAPNRVADTQTRVSPDVTSLLDRAERAARSTRDLADILIA